jgi:DHA1 family tetracycline resistance protein-like MFS transporter
MLLGMNGRSAPEAATREMISFGIKPYQCELTPFVYFSYQSLPRTARKFQAFFGASFVMGPVIGGVLGDISLRDPFLAAAALNGVNLSIALFLLPESHRRERKPFDWRALNPLAPLRWALTFRALIPLLAVFFLVSLVGQTYSTVWVLFVTDRFRWTGAEIGLSLALSGALVIIAQAFAIGPVTPWLGERGTLLLGIACETVALLILAFAQASWIAFALIP